MSPSSPGTPHAEDADRSEDGQSTAGVEYAERLRRLQGARWKSSAVVQAPFRLHLRALKLGRCLDIGCGVGRLLRHMDEGSVGVDHNATSVAICRERGLQAFTTDEFLAGGVAAHGTFDSMMVAHVLEHVGRDVGDSLLRDYLPYLRPGASVVVMTPQEVGQRSDATHVRWVDHEAVLDHAQRLGLRVEKRYSFPFPRPVGRVFIYNEFVTVLRAG